MEEDEEEWTDGRKWRMRKNRQTVGGIGIWERIGDSRRWRRLKKAGKIMGSGGKQGEMRWQVVEDMSPSEAEMKEGMRQWEMDKDDRRDGETFKG